MAEPLFEKANQAAAQEDYDSAIELYLEALRADPENVDGHIKLREVALSRQEKNAPGPTDEEKAELFSGDTAVERMLKAEYLLAKDPNHMPYAEAMLRAATEARYARAARWIGDLMFLANNNARKPSLQIYLMLKDAYAKVGQYDRAVAACQRASKLKPGDRALVQQLRSLSARLRAVQKRTQKPRSNGLSDVDHTAELGEKPADESQKLADEQMYKAKAFFEKARKTAETGNFDYAIEMYLDGIEQSPDALEEGHLPLCELALKRRSKGGKKPTMMEKVKKLGGKTPVEQLKNAEYLFAKDPDHIPYAEAMLEAAVAGDFNKTAGWLANLIFQTNNAANKPSLKTYKLLKDAYRKLGQFDKALAACQKACQMKPGDADLQEDFKYLSAELTMARGNYDKDGDFRNSIKDREAQEQLHAQSGVVKSEDYRQIAIDNARKKAVAEPDLPKNIFALADALFDSGNSDRENEAIALLEKTYEKTDNFTFKQHAGELQIKQTKRRIRQAKSILQKHPDNGAARGRLKELNATLNEVELEHFRQCMENYPTDLRHKYDYAVRLVRAGRHDEAIPLFQEAQRDPRRKLASMSQIGQCFFAKGWYSDAIDVLTQAIDQHEIKDDSFAKELRYNLARACEEKGETAKAFEIYRKIAQLDFSFRDVSKRVDRLRK